AGTHSARFLGGTQPAAALEPALADQSHRVLAGALRQPGAVLVGGDQVDVLREDQQELHGVLLLRGPRCGPSTRYDTAGTRGSTRSPSYRLPDQTPFHATVLADVGREVLIGRDE